MNLSEFLLARIAEDEAVARGASPGPWHPNAERDEVLAVDDITVCDGFALSGPQTRATTTHIARHDPARVLAECESKRRILEAFLDADRAVATYDHAHPTDAYWQEWGNRHALALAVELLGVPYAAHPDYDEAWRP